MSVLYQGKTRFHRTTSMCGLALPTVGQIKLDLGIRSGHFLQQIRTTRTSCGLIWVAWNISFISLSKTHLPWPTASWRKLTNLGGIFQLWRKFATHGGAMPKKLLLPGYCYIPSMHVTTKGQGFFHLSHWLVVGEQLQVGSLDQDRVQVISTSTENQWLKFIINNLFRHAVMMSHSHDMLYSYLYTVAVYPALSALGTGHWVQTLLQLSLLFLYVYVSADCYTPLADLWLQALRSSLWTIIQSESLLVSWQSSTHVKQGGFWLRERKKWLPM